MFKAPTSTAPAASSRSISGEWCGLGTSSRLIFEPARVARPVTSNRFLTAKGTPASGPFVLPASISAARLRARSATTSVNALSTGSRSVMRASAASVTLSADTRPAVTAAAMSAAEAHSVSMSGFEDRRGLGIVRQLLLADQRGKLECDFEIGAHGGLPLLLDRNAERVGG